MSIQYPSVAQPQMLSVLPAISGGEVADSPGHVQLAGSSGSVFNRLICFACILLLGCLTARASGAEVSRFVVYCDSNAPQVAFADAEIRAAAGGKWIVETRSLADLGSREASNRIVIAYGPDARRIAASLHLEPLSGSLTNTSQAYGLRRKVEQGRATYAVFASDPAGALYGGLDVAEAIRFGNLHRLQDADHSPYIARRGIKFNIPLDARTPSYSDAGDSAQQNIPEMWSMDFWKEFLDEMARDRYNVLSLWNLNPFPSMVKVPEYPDIALADVKRTSIRFEDHTHTGTDMWSPTIAAHLETVKQMTIDDKIRFWRDVMQYAHDRGIEVYLFTWNIFTFGTDGKYGISSDPTNAVTIDYLRKSVREVIRTYPLLAGIGLTAGENMPGLDDAGKEKWLWDTYGEGVRDAMQLQPSRKFRLIHRQHQASLDSILKQWKDLPATFDLSYKYSVAHMYSDPRPPFAQRDILGIMPPNLRVWMEVRNDDIYSFRWGDPEYARAYIRNLPGPDKLEGFNMGPDGYIWGREVTSTEPDSPRQLMIKKQWYSFVLWGRLSYEPALQNTLFEQMLAHRYPEVPAAKLFEASAHASRIIPRATTFFWGDIDLKWLPEASSGHPAWGGFYTVDRTIHGESMPGSGVLSIHDYLENVFDGKNNPGMTPLEVARDLHANAAAALRIVAEMRPATNKELRLTLGDCEAMAHLGDYYAEKILGATDLALFERTGKPEQKESAVRHLQAALAAWKEYAAVATAQYKPQLLTRIGYFDLNQLTPKVEQDIATAQRAKPSEVQSIGQTSHR